MTAPPIEFLEYADIRDYLLPLVDDPANRKIVFNPGPATNQMLQKLSPQAIVFISIGGGAGLTTEQMFDRPFIGIRVVGRQNDYDGAEELANVIDLSLLKRDTSGMVGSTYTLYITRTGGRPQVVEYDVANRYHFSCTYIAEAATGR